MSNVQAVLKHSGEQFVAFHLGTLAPRLAEGRSVSAAATPSPLRCSGTGTRLRPHCEPPTGFEPPKPSALATVGLDGAG